MSLHVHALHLSFLSSLFLSRPSSMYTCLRFHSVKQPAHSAPGTQGAAGTVSITVDGNPSYPPWNEPFSPYTPSSSYPSPIPAAGDLSTFPTPYGGSVRGTREPSIAEPSFEPSPWVYAPQSPTSATSPLVLWGPSTEKSPVPPGTIFPHSSFSMTSPAIPTSLELGPGFMGGHYPTMRSLAERDEDDQRMLFPDQYGMGHIPETYPLEQYSDNYWRLFHPAFPILHKPTYGSLTESPMLRAAILAIGAQYSTDACAKRKARILVDRCLKRLEMVRYFFPNACISFANHTQRDLEPTAEPPRLCDYQAIFLLEVLAQYRARRAAPGLSRRFEEMYLKVCCMIKSLGHNTHILQFANECNPHDMSGILDNISSLNPDGDWIRWIDLSSQQRLLQCCYILETQQTTLLARTHTRSLINNTGYNLPFPVPTDLWDAQNANAWAMTASQYGHLPSTLYEMNQMGAPALDRFQSSFLIAAHYNHFENPSPYLSPSRIQDIDHLVDSSLITQHHLLTAKLLQATPIRELLAVSGESWILSEKVTSMRSFSDYRSTVKTWVTKLWNTNADSGSQIVKDALKAAVSILRQALLDEDLSVEFGVEMGLYYAVLVIWAVTVAATTRTRPNNQQVRHPSPHPLSSHRASHYPSASVHLTPANSNSPSPLHNNAMGGGIPQPTPSSSPSPLLNLTPEFSSQCLNFLDLAVFDLDLIHSVPNWPGNVSQWQQGCVQLLRWTKLRLRNGQPENRDGVVPGQGPTSAAGTATNGRGCGGDSLGELLDCVVANLEKLSGRGWEGWGF